MYSNRTVPDAAVVWDREGFHYSRRYLILPSETSAAVSGARMESAMNLLPNPDTAVPVGGILQSARAVRPAGVGAMFEGLTEWGPADVALYDFSGFLKSASTNLGYDSGGILNTPLVTIQVAGGEEQGHLVDKMQPEIRVRATKRFDITDFVPLSLSGQYLGRTNSDPWPPSAPQAIGTWLCTAIEVRAYRAADLDYEGVLEFAFQANGWKTTVVHLDDSNDPIPDPQDGTSQRDYDLYFSVGFAGLEFDL